MQSIIITAFITAGLCTACFVTYGQTFSEWWRQKKTRIKYLRQQVAALQALKATFAEGYEGAEEGIDSDKVEMMLLYKKAEVYLTSLGNVKPVFRRSDLVHAVYGLAKVHAEIAEEDLAVFSTSKWLSASEREQLAFQFDMVKTVMDQMVKSIRLLITDGKIEMDDANRWEMIEGMEEQVETIGRFLLARIHETSNLIEARQQEEASDKFLEKSLN